MLTDKRYIVILSLILLIAGSSLHADDSTYAAPLPDSMMVDSTVIDSTTADSLSSDSTQMLLGPPDVDSTNLENRLEAIMAEASKPQDTMPIIIYNFYDTLQAHFLEPVEDYSDKLKRSFFYDAGDFAKFNPSNLVIHYRFTPIRTTVSPFGLPGNRMNVVFNDQPLTPFDHAVEPDNQLDFNDIPTTPVQKIYNIEGPFGMVYGSDNATSSMILTAHKPEIDRADSRMVVEKGWYGYAYTKALFAYETSRGKSLKGGIGYRKALGSLIQIQDNATHHWYEAKFPYKKRLRFDFSLRLYRREGVLPYGLITNSEYFGRYRKDVDLSGAVNIGHSETRSSRITIARMTDEAERDGRFADYYSFLKTERTIGELRHDARVGSYSLQLNLHGEEENYKDYKLDHTRRRGYGELKLTRGDSTRSILYYAKVEKVGGFDPHPSGMIAVTSGNDLVRFNGSAGYATRFPRQYEMDLVAQSSSILNATGTDDYLEVGNSALQPEKQMTGNLSLALGRKQNDLTLSLTGGKIFDGIDWVRHDSLGLTLTAIRPVNHDIEFANLTAVKNIRFADNIFWSGGGSYRYIKVADDDNPPYAPDYQLFSSLQLYYYIGKLDLHLYGYTEAYYLGDYHGYDDSESLGEKLIASFKVSFRIKKFRFYYIFQNLPEVDYTMREHFIIPGRYDFYGFTWDFID